VLVKVHRLARSGGLVLLQLAWWSPPLQACQEPANLLTNCGFDADLSGWVLDLGTFTHVSADGSSQPGCVEGESVGSGTFGAHLNLKQQLPWGLGAASRGYGVDFRVVSGSASCSVGVQAYWEPSCLTQSASSVTDFTPGAAWAQAQGTYTAGTYQCAYVAIFCYGSEPFRVRFDDAFFGVGLVPVALEQFTIE
jgi:hypothetical protein